ncbi:porin family protein [Paracoccus sp. CPCC 101403]|uniref:Porin family protein n=2 Tax=Paracoccus broussonetiae TaxID=3075834 RepID=A0ABU3EBJ7_9RHOB|nr:porin family protein [Paracoccus sp. CPCC 101403]MDT1061592.1 porin family protein [Paracoccus sp. CPCC 101403]
MKLACYAILAGLTATAASAGGYVAPVVETPVVAPVEPVAPGVDWTGWYAGVQYGQGSADSNYAGDSDMDGYGLHGGYMHDFGNFVLGGELDYNRISLDETDEDGDLWRLRGRAGYDMGKFLPYATLGVAQLEAGDLSETGITYGLGADYMINDKFTVGAEYTRNDFKDVADVDNADLDTDLFQIRASYRF